MTDKLTFSAANADVRLDQDSDDGSILFFTTSGPSVEVRLPRESLRDLREELERVFGARIRDL
ncbi:MAG TPA: hypothetical protein VGF33_08560 [Caulobacteraceae bacterium]|jgi:hypothetical protein